MHIAIIGSGPAGCYLADQLVRLIPNASIDILEKLPVPFGLIRYGVAPDHQGTKAIARVFDRLLSRDQVSFFGNVEVGRDVQLDELISVYDAVILATGAERDRRLGIPGEDLLGVLGSRAFTGWYNSHPCRTAPMAQDVQSVVIIGNGNVAIDVARVLAKDTSELLGSDLSPEATEWLATQPLESIHIIGRRSACDARFTPHEVAELGSLQRVRAFIVEPPELPADGPIIETLRSLTAQPSRPAPVTMTFHFNLRPVAFSAGPSGKLSAAQFRSANGSIVNIPAQMAITCIGYESEACCSAMPTNGTFGNEDGKIKDRLYVAGWARRGSTGTIPTNRTEAQQLAQKIAQEVVESDRPGRAGLRQLLEKRQVDNVAYQGWRSIDAAELACAGEGRSRRKFQIIADMLEAAKKNELRPA